MHVAVGGNLCWMGYRYMHARATEYRYCILYGISLPVSLDKIPLRYFLCTDAVY